MTNEEFENIYKKAIDSINIAKNNKDNNMEFVKDDVNNDDISQKKDESSSSESTRNLMDEFNDFATEHPYGVGLAFSLLGLFAAGKFMENVIANGIRKGTSRAMRDIYRS